MCRRSQTPASIGKEASRKGWPPANKWDATTTITDLSIRGTETAITNNNDSSRSQSFTCFGLNRLLTARTVNTSSANWGDLALDYDMRRNLPAGNPGGRCLARIRVPIHSPRR